MSNHIKEQEIKARRDMFEAFSNIEFKSSDLKEILIYEALGGEIFPVEIIEIASGFIDPDFDLIDKQIYDNWSIDIIKTLVNKNKEKNMKRENSLLLTTKFECPEVFEKLDGLEEDIDPEVIKVVSQFGIYPKNNEIVLMARKYTDNTNIIDLIQHYLFKDEPNEKFTRTFDTDENGDTTITTTWRKQNMDNCKTKLEIMLGGSYYKFDTLRLAAVKASIVYMDDIQSQAFLNNIDYNMDPYMIIYLGNCIKEGLSINEFKNIISNSCIVTPDIFKEAYMKLQDKKAETDFRYFHQVQTGRYLDIISDKMVVALDDDQFIEYMQWVKDTSTQLFDFNRYVDSAYVADVE